jgi:tRNA (cytidine/uridine-2'-O-)-methyltransferase
MLEMILYQPEIPPNTGNIIRLCANTGARLHLIKPLGFHLNDKQLRRAGLDYHESACLAMHENLDACLTKLGRQRIFAVTTKATQQHDKVSYTNDDVFLFGSETCGLPKDLLEKFPHNRCIRIPMLPARRSLNLSNAAAIIAYEAWRQNGFSGGI